MNVGGMFWLALSGVKLLYSEWPATVVTQTQSRAIIQPHKYNKIGDEIPDYMHIFPQFFFLSCPGKPTCDFGSFTDGMICDQLI